MIIVNFDGKIMVRRCLVILRFFWFFVLGIGFFIFCFLMMFLGGQFLVWCLGDLLFIICIEVMGGFEFCGILCKMSDLLELMVKCMDVLVRLENSSELYWVGGDLYFFVDRMFFGVGFMEWIQVIVQNVFDIVVKVDQILCYSLFLYSKVLEGWWDQCEVFSDFKFFDCLGKVEWMCVCWIFDFCYVFFGVDGIECFFFIYFSEVEWFCFLLFWRNQMVVQRVFKFFFKVQVVF